MREGEPEAGAAEALGGVVACVAVVGGDELAGDGKSEAGALDFAEVGVGTPFEPVPDGDFVLLGMPAPLSCTSMMV